MSVSSHYLLYNTDEIDDSDNAYNCIDFIESDYDYLLELKSNDILQIISYCIRPSPYDTQYDLSFSEHGENMQRSFQIHTFEQLRLEYQLTAEKLILSSEFTSLDVIERYKIYLNTLNESMSKEKVYRCEQPWFGTECQYHLNVPNLTSIMRDRIKYLEPRTFREKYVSEVLEVNMPCYTHLICNRGPPPACLDWREICDGKIDCANDGIDESFCDPNNTHFCSGDEFRCLDGHQCIPKEFYHDDLFNPDCQDGSDEILSSSNEPNAYSHTCYRDVAFRCEERRCPPQMFACGDGQCVIYAENCNNHRGELMMMEFLYDSELAPKSPCSPRKLSCVTHIENVEDCRGLCWTSQIRLCNVHLRQMCASTVFTQPPSEFIQENHIHIFYDSKAIPASKAWIFAPQADCTNDTFCPETEIYDDDPSLRWCQRSQTRMSLKYMGSYSRTDFTATINRLKNKCSKKSVQSDNNYALSYQYEQSGKNTLQTLMLDCFTLDDILSGRRKLVDECIKNKTIYESRNMYEIHKKSDPYNWTLQFPIYKFCDGIQNLKPLFIDGINQTDETDCEHWSCNNIYTRCDGYRNCPDGRDELNCTLRRCWNSEHLCVSLISNRIECLPRIKVLDSKIDCVGGTDEYDMCPRSPNSSYRLFLCSTRNKCIDVKFVCDGKQHCPQGEDEYICNSFSFAIVRFLLYCGSSIISMYSHSKLLYCSNHSFFTPITFFSLFNPIPYPRLFKSIQAAKHSQLIVRDTNTNVVSTDIAKHSINDIHHYCHRGLDMYMTTLSYPNLLERRCLCPPAYYGNRCQYQTDRVSLTLKISSYATIRNGFVFLITLIDEKRYINSFVIRQYHPSIDCNAKVTYYLLYSSPMKDKKKNYSIHIDAFLQETLTYHASWNIPIYNPHLPVTQISVILEIPIKSIVPTKTSHCNLRCRHGQCVKYINMEKSFCQCRHGWKGLLCNMKKYCDCSTDSLCMGSSNGRSICICPVHKYGPRCLLNSICSNTVCHNGGTCMAIATANGDSQNSLHGCICKDEFEGVNCRERKMTVSLQFTGIQTYSFMIVHTFSTFTIESRKHTVTFKQIPIGSTTTMIYIPTELDANLVFIQFDKSYYLVVVRESNVKSPVISTSVSPKRQCHDVRDLIKLPVAQFHPLRHWKYYPKLCREQTNLVCFHDEKYMCFCTSDQYVGCFEFNSNRNFTCDKENSCEKEGQCFEVHLQCSFTRECRCSECYYGSRCQFSTIGLGVSLDAILGYHIQPMENFLRQSMPVQVSAIITIVMFTFGLISSVMALITFRRSKSLEVGCGKYLLATSIASLLTMSMFALKFWFFLLAQLSIITHPVFLYVNCLSIDVLTTICLSISNWLVTCVAIERTVNVIQGTKFNKQRSKTNASWIIVGGIFFIILTYLPDPFHRVLLDVDSERRIWCIVRYPATIATYIWSNLFFHFVAPCAVNTIAAIIVIVKTARINFIGKRQDSYFKCFLKQFHHLKHHLISSGILILIYVPRLLLAFLPSCMKLTEDPWIYLAGYFVSFLPPVLIFPIFVLPSDLFRKEFLTQVGRFLTVIDGACQHCRSTRRLTHQ